MFTVPVSEPPPRIAGIEQEDEMSLGLVRADLSQLPYKTVEERRGFSFVSHVAEPNNRVSVGPPT